MLVNVSVGAAKQMEGGSVAASTGSTVILTCRTASPVNHAEWDFHRLNTGTPTVIYDGSVVNPNLSDKYSISYCNVSSTTCNLRINRLQQSDDGEYQCYLETNNETLKIVHRLSVIHGGYRLILAISSTLRDVSVS